LTEIRHKIGTLIEALWLHKMMRLTWLQFRNL